MIYKYTKQYITHLNSKRFFNKNNHAFPRLFLSLLLRVGSDQIQRMQIKSFSIYFEIDQSWYLDS